MSLQVQVLQHLEQLVKFNTTNPPRKITTGGIFSYLTDALPGFDHTLNDYGDGCISLLAVRGNPKYLFNFHIDTVPASTAWSSDPWTLLDHGDRVTGLGSCDIKGASACMLAVAAQSRGDLALLFTSDEEAGNSRCIRSFTATDHGFDKVIVAEPTNTCAVTAHRGIVSGTVRFSGRAGHASGARASSDSAVHQAIEWGQNALAWATAQDDAHYENLSGLRFNIGTINGGIKPNIIAPEAELRFGMRTLPDMNQSALISELQTQTLSYKDAELTPGFVAPPLNPSAQTLVEILALPSGPAVDFWTEAALFAASGMEAIVFGPGDIAQAHTADEWVAKEQLQAVCEHYLRIVDHGTA